MLQQQNKNTVFSCAIIKDQTGAEDECKLLFIFILGEGGLGDQKNEDDISSQCLKTVDPFEGK